AGTCGRVLCLALGLRISYLRTVSVQDVGRKGCGQHTEARYSGGHYEYADASAVLEENFRLTVSDFRLLVPKTMFSIYNLTSGNLRSRKLGRRLMVGQVPLEHFV